MIVIGVTTINAGQQTIDENVSAITHTLMSKNVSMTCLGNSMRPHSRNKSQKPRTGSLSQPLAKECAQVR